MKLNDTGMTDEQDDALMLLSLVIDDFEDDPRISEIADLNDELKGLWVELYKMFEKQNKKAK